MPPGSSKEGKPATLSIVYRHDFRSPVRVGYDSTDDSFKVSPNAPKTGIFKEAGNFLMTGGGEWKVLEFPIPDPRFQKRCNGGDLRLESMSDHDLVIGGIYVR